LLQGRRFPRPTTLSVAATAAALLVLPLLGVLGTASAAAAAHARTAVGVSISKVSPSAGPLAGGTTVTVTGKGLRAVRRVTFGGLAGTHLVIRSATRLTVRAPKHTTGSVAVRLVLANGAKTPETSKATFGYIPKPSVQSVSPSSGMGSGGTVVTITGSYLKRTQRVLFGSTPGKKLTILSPSKVRVTSPGHTPTTVRVTVVTPGGATAAKTQFTFKPNPIVTGVSPSAGPLTRGTTVTISGTHFDRASAVDFGSQAAANLVVVSPTRLRVSAPAGTARAVGVTVETPWGTSPKSTKATYTFQAPPTLSAVNPMSTPAAGTVTLVGTNLSRTSVVTFAGVRSPKVTNVSATQVTAVVPSGLPLGMATVGLSTPGGSTTGHEYIRTLAAVGNASYNWWCLPTAVNDGNYTWVSSVSRSGQIQLSRIDRTTANGAVTTIELGTVRADDHNTPVIAFSPDRQNLMVFWTDHNASNVFKYRKVDRTTMVAQATSSLQFSAPTTYAQILQAGGRIALFTRVDSSTWAYRAADQWAPSESSWGPEQTVIDASGLSQVYTLARPLGPIAYESNGLTSTKYTLAFYGHPAHSTFRDITYETFTFNADGSPGPILTSSGAQIGAIDDPSSPGGPALTPTQLGDPTKDGTAVKLSDDVEKVRVIDATELKDAGGVIHEVLLYAHADQIPDTQPATYRLAVSDSDGTWHTLDWSVSAGVPLSGDDLSMLYVAGGVFDANNALYLSRWDTAAQTWTLQKWTLQSWDFDNSANIYAIAQTIHEDPLYEIARPSVPTNPGLTSVLAEQVLRYAPPVPYEDYYLDTYWY
jgi:hypothetical protein